MSEYSTEQEYFWAGEFGDAYISRNDRQELIDANAIFFARVLSRCGRICSAIEFGANTGPNLQALRRVLPDLQLAAIEINEKAVMQLRKIDALEVVHGSFLEVALPRTYDLAISKGVLIHVAPERLRDAYHAIHRASHKFILLAEYYSPQPVEIEYRGYRNKLYKRDFAGELLDLFPDLRLIDYGFVYHRDHFPQDDITWFLMEKINA